MEHSQRRPDIKPSKVTAAALAAVTSAFVGSRLGIAGTVFGAGFASVVTTVGSALYQKSLDRTGRSLRSKMGIGQDEPAHEPTVALTPVSGSAPTVRLTRRTAPGPASPVPDPSTRRMVDEERTEVLPRRMVSAPSTPRRPPNWRRVALAALVVFAVGMIAVTGVELVRGGPLSGGKGGTTMGDLFAPTSAPAVPQSSAMPSTLSPTGQVPTSTSSPSVATSGSTAPSRLAPPPGPGITGATTTTTPTTPTPTTHSVTTTPTVVPWVHRASG